MTRFDAIVVGAGQAGPSLARRLAQAGMKVAVAERKLFGGTCVNTGCTPTKTLVASAYAAFLARRAADFGVRIGGEVSVDFAAAMARMAEIVERSRSGVETGLRDEPNCTVFNEHARFVGPREMAVGGERISADRIFLDVGGRAVIPPMPGIDQVKVLDNSSLLDLRTLPRRLVVVGGSYVGLEFAQVFRRFGSEVTVVEKGPRLIGREDPDVSDAVRQAMEREGVKFRLNAECISFRPAGDQIAVGVECATGEPETLGSDVLMAVGRRPNTDDLGAEAAGLELDAKGFVKVDDELKTSVEGVWALGECNGRGAFTHTTWDDYEIVAANLLEGASRKVTHRIQAYALFTDPPLGRAGMTEAEARASGRRVLVGARPMERVARAVEKGETLGLMKILVDADSREILGGAILGVGGDEAIHAVLAAMYARAPDSTLRQAVFIHPTVSELIPTLLGELKPLA